MGGGVQTLAPLSHSVGTELPSLEKLNRLTERTSPPMPRREASSMSSGKSTSMPAKTACVRCFVKLESSVRFLFIVSGACTRTKPCDAAQLKTQRLLCSAGSGWACVRRVPCRDEFAYRDEFDMMTQTVDAAEEDPRAPVRGNGSECTFQRRIPFRGHRGSIGCCKRTASCSLAFRQAPSAVSLSRVQLVAAPWAPCYAVVVHAHASHNRLAARGEHAAAASMIKHEVARGCGFGHPVFAGTPC